MVKIRLTFDSRGHALKPKIEEILSTRKFNHERLYTIVSGGTLETIMVQALREQRFNYADVQFNFGGVNNLTELRKNYIEPKFDNGEILAKNLFSDTKNVHDLYRNYIKKSVACELTGLDVDYYNWKKYRLVTYYTDEQLAIDSGIPIYNGMLPILNDISSLGPPRTASYIHPYRNGKFYTNYGLLHDGIHAMPETSTYWANQIADCLCYQFID